MMLGPSSPKLPVAIPEPASAEVRRMSVMVWRGGHAARKSSASECRGGMLDTIISHAILMCGPQRRKGNAGELL